MDPRQLLLFSTDGDIPEAIDGSPVDPEADYGHKSERSDKDIGKEAFEYWLATHSPRFRLSSVKVYRALWDKFLKFQESRKIQWGNFTPEVVKEFLSSLTDSKLQHRDRYQSVIERAFEEIAEFQNAQLINPASKIEVGVHKGEEWRDAQDNEPTQFLGNMDQLILKDSLINVSNTLTSHSFSPPTRWRLSRDTAIVTALFACGIKPAELTVLSVNCIIINEEGAFFDMSSYQGLAVQERSGAHSDPNQDATHAYIGPDRGSERTVLIPPWAHLILSQWLSIRPLDQTTHSEGFERLFPGNRKITVHRKSSLMNPATLARIVTKWGRDHADLTLTPQRLRNTYGASLVQAGDELAVIEQKMGYAPGAGSAFRLKQAWINWAATKNR